MKRITFLLLFLILISHLTKAQTNNIWNGDYNTDWYNSSLTEFTINTAEDLAGLAYMVNNKGYDFFNKTIKLGNDIYLNDTTDWHLWGIDTNIPRNSWIPIGNDDYPFCGNFNGQGFSVYGLYINAPSTDNCGLIGRVATKKDNDTYISISDTNIKCSYICGNYNVGGVVGYIYMHPSGSLGALSGSIKIEKCSNYGLIKGAYSGGIVGYADTANSDFDMINCNNYGPIYGTNVGGILGGNKTSNQLGYSFEIKDNSNFGNIHGTGYAGGIISHYNITLSYDSNIINCKNHGNIQSRTNVGGIVGYMIASDDSWSSVFGQVYIKECVNLGEISGGEMLGGIVGHCSAGCNIYLTNNYNHAKILGTKNYTGGITGKAFGNISFSNSYNIGEISGQYGVGGILGEYNSPIYSNKSITIANSCYNLGNVSGNNNVGGVIGNFDASNTVGNNKVSIYDCYNHGNINTVENVAGGVAGRISGNAAVKYCYNIGKVTGKTNIGSIAGECIGTASHCYYLLNSSNDGIGYYDPKDYQTFVSCIEEYSSDSFSSGEICWLLNKETNEGVWGQNITFISKDKYPVLNGLMVYEKEDGNFENKENIVYENSAWETKGMEENCILINNEFGIVSTFSASVWMMVKEIPANGKNSVVMDINGVTLLAENSDDKYSIILRNTNKDVAVNKDLEYNRWYHISLSQKGNMCNLYVDGLNVLSKTDVSYNKYDEFKYGENLNAVFDEIMIWNSSLNDIQIKESMKGYINLPVSLVGYYSLDIKDAESYSPNNNSKYPNARAKYNSVDEIDYQLNITEDRPTPRGGAKFYYGTDESTEIKNWLTNGDEKDFGYLYAKDICKLDYSRLSISPFSQDESNTNGFITSVYHHGDEGFPYYVKNTESITVEGNNKVERSFLVSGIEYSMSMPSNKEWLPISLPEKIDLVYNQTEQKILRPMWNFWYCSFNKEYTDSENYSDVWLDYIKDEDPETSKEYLLEPGIISVPESKSNHIFSFYTQINTPVVMRALNEQFNASLMPAIGRIKFVENPYAFDVTVSQLVSGSMDVYRFNAISGNFDIIAGDDFVSTTLKPFEPVFVFNNNNGMLKAPRFIGLGTKDTTTLEYEAVYDVNIRSSEGAVEVVTYQPTIVKVFTLSGVMVAEDKVDGIQRFTLDAGIYLVNSFVEGNTQSFKVVVK